MDSKEINPVVPNIIPGPGPRPVGKPVQIPPTSGPGFRQILESVAAPGQPLKFSAHATARLQSRNINLSSEDIAKMNVMADKAAAKGAKQSLFIMRDVALVVSVKNRTVITAVDQDSMRENVFTNIDSAAII
ncbi:MAG: TIGR02530 family flagellar biosynthesis protein [Candidatus Baltobacteraceae bacterium]